MKTINLSTLLEEKEIKGEILLYRDDEHKKLKLCEHLVSVYQNEIEKKGHIVVYSGGAFGLYMAKAMPNNCQITICGSPTQEYLKQIEKIPNTNVEYGTVIKQAELFAETLNALYINQFGDTETVRYYKKHFEEINKEINLSSYVFVDCGHSCATMAGAEESKLFKKCVLTVTGPMVRRNCHFCMNKNIEQTTCYGYDTLTLQKEIETRYPDFGNVFEATRSIAGAINYLDKNPNEKIFIYVGDSPVYGE